MSIPTPPTGLYTVVYRNEIDIFWVKNPETNVKGYNIYNTTTSGGGISGYVKLNDVLIEQYSLVRKDVLTSSEQVTVIGPQRTTTTTEILQDVYIFEYQHTGLTEEKVQYYVVTAVNDLGEESPYSIEIKGTPLIISTSVVVEPLRTQNDVSLDYISTMLEREPKLDVKPGSVTRQLHIDPNSREFSFVYVRRDFTARAQSFLTLNDLDDSDDDRISDPVSSNTYKQLLKTAYFFTTDEEVQTMIDFAYDKLAANAGTFRQPATQAETTVTFFTDTAPTVDITVNLGEIVSTVPTEIQAAISFATLSAATMQVAYISNYFNIVTQRYELNVPVQAVIAGASGNVNANTIITTNVAGFQVTNLTSAFGGTDKESNADLADRAEIAFVGLDVGTYYGYEKTVTKIPSVTDVKVVDAGHPLMQRDYDDVRKKHVFGKVDIYIRGGTPIATQDTFGFLYKENIDDYLQIVNVTSMIVKTVNPVVTIVKPIFSVREIRNVSQAKLYDILGNWTVFKNAVELVKTTEISMDLALGQMTFTTALVFGDVITANYDYKKQITNEIIISPALGGEVNFTLDFFPIVKRSYTIFKNSVALVEGTNYNLNKANGFLQLTAGLSAGDILTATYKYIVPITAEIVIASATGGEVTANLVNLNVLESLTIGLDGISLEIEPTNVINSSVGMIMTDVITATYRYRDSDPILLLQQPADSIVSVVSSVSGQLTAGSQYVFNKNDDILLLGNSIKADRTVQILYSGGAPVGELLQGTEDIVLVNNNYQELIQKGIDTESIIVKDNTQTYLRTTDYLIKVEGGGNNVQIARSTTSAIPNGGTVTVSYEYGELLTITYNVNPLVNIVQQAIEPVRHVTADVLVKAVLQTKLDFDISVVINPGTDKIQVSNDIRTSISNELFKKKLGQGVAQSDIIRVIEGVTNVISVLVPLTKMVKADGTQINREYVGVPFTLYQSNIVNSYTTGTNALLQKTLGSNAGDGFYAIFEDDRPLTLVTNANIVDDAAGLGFISSNGEVIVSTIDGDSPSAHTYTVSYIVMGETGAKDIIITDLEYLYPGNIVIATAFAS